MSIDLFTIILYLLRFFLNHGYLMKKYRKSKFIDTEFKNIVKIFYLDCFINEYWKT